MALPISAIKIENCLIIEDNLEVARILKTTMQEICGSVEVVSDGAQASAKLRTMHRGIVVMDFRLPYLNGKELLVEFRKYNKECPVLFVSAQGSAVTKVEILSLGADDYLQKPFSAAELQLRALKIYHAYCKQSLGTKLTYKSLEIDRYKRVVYQEQERVELQPKEYALLELLLMNPGKIVDKKLILKEIFEIDFVPRTNVVDVLVCRLRSKINKGDANFCWDNALILSAKT